MTDQSQQDRLIVKRPRPVLSCLECRRKKLKCDRLLPCQQCLKLNQPSLCKYAPGQEPEARENATDLKSSTKRPRHDSVDQPSRANSEQIDELQDRVRRLEHALRTQQASQATPSLPEVHDFPVAGPVSRRDTPESESPHCHVADYSKLDEDFFIFEKVSDKSLFVALADNGSSKMPSISANLSNSIKLIQTSRPCHVNSRPYRRLSPRASTSTEIHRQYITVRPP